MFGNNIEKYSPVGEYLRIAILDYLVIRRVASLDEVDDYVKRICDDLHARGIKYTCDVWPELLKREVFINKFDNTVRITPYGEAIYYFTRDEVLKYVSRHL